MATAQTERKEEEEGDDRDEVTVLIKNPKGDWDVPVEVYEDREKAEERQSELGIRLETFREVARLVDAPVVDRE